MLVRSLPTLSLPLVVAIGGRQLFLHPSEYEALEEAAARRLEEAQRINPKFTNQLPWLLDRMLMLVCTVVCMPVAIVNIEGLVSFLSKQVVWLTWNRNPGFKPEAAWYQGLVPSGAVPCELVYDSLDLLGYLVGFLTLAAFMINYIIVHWQSQKGTLVCKVLSVVVWPWTQTLLALFLGEQLLSKLLLGNKLQEWRPMFDLNASKDAVAEATPEWLVAKLSPAFPAHVLKNYFANFVSSTV